MGVVGKREERMEESENNRGRVKVNVGGKMFETRRSTLESWTVRKSDEVLFIDGDPEVFSSILSMLRTQKHKQYHKDQELVLRESRLYGLNNKISRYLYPPPLSPFDASLITSLTPPCSPIVTAYCCCCNSPIILAHSGQVSFYDPVTLSLLSSFPTHLNHISSVASFSDFFALASHSSSGLHVYASTTGLHLRTVFWFDPLDTRIDKSTVTAIAPDPPLLSAAFHSKHGENAILLIDKNTLNVVSEFGRQNSAKSSPINKIRWVPSLGLLVATSINSTPFGYSAYVSLWDPRSPHLVWDTHEPRALLSGDTMADVDVDPHNLFLAKVGSKSGHLAVADLRNLGPNPWLYLDDPNPPNSTLASSVLLHCYQGNVFVSRDGELQAWSTMDGHTTWPMFRRTFVDKPHHSRRGIITNLQGGANRLFLTRANVEGVEVWETSPSSGLISLI